MKRRQKHEIEDLASHPSPDVGAKRGRAALGPWGAGGTGLAEGTSQAIQYAGSPKKRSQDEVARIAQEGTAGSGETLPYLDQISEAFGHVDLSGVRAFVGGAAAKANAEIGSRAYASGGVVAFAETPDLRTTAHETAHLIQQIRGQFTEGNRAQLETHADAVADRVVSGRSAADLLGTGGAIAGMTTGAVQLTGEDIPVTRGGTPTMSMHNEAALWIATQAALGTVPRANAANGATSVPLILRECMRANVHDANQVAYILATAEHESGFDASSQEQRNGIRQGADGVWRGRNHVTGGTSQGNTRGAAVTDYWDDAYGGRLGNAAGTTDGQTYRGRGFVQLTGRANYQNMSTVLTEAGFTYSHEGITYGTPERPIDLENNPTHVNEVPQLASRLLVEGSVGGHYTGRGLDDYINDDGVDFTNARRVINGTDRAGDIAVIAQRYADVLAEGEVWKNVFRGNAADVRENRAQMSFAPRGGAGGQTQFDDPTPGDEVRVQAESGETRPWTLHGSTRRFAALMHIYESGDFGTGGLTPNTVVGANGMTLAEVYQSYRRGEIGCTNAVLDTVGAAERVQDIRNHGWCHTPELLTAAGLDPNSGGFDGPGHLNIVPGSQIPREEAIDDTLGFERGMRAFVERGHVPDVRSPGIGATGRVGWSSWKTMARATGRSGAVSRSLERIWRPCVRIWRTTPPGARASGARRWPNIKSTSGTRTTPRSTAPPGHADHAPPRCTDLPAHPPRRRPAPRRPQRTTPKPRHRRGQRQDSPKRRTPPVETPTPGRAPTSRLGPRTTCANDCADGWRIWRRAIPRTPGAARRSVRWRWSAPSS